MSMTSKKTSNHPRFGAVSHDSRFRWGVDDKGMPVMPSAVAEFMDWLLSFPRVPATFKEYAEQHDVHERTLRSWKADPRFVKEWEARASELNVGIERVQAVMDNLFAIASTRQDAAGVAAANQYLQMVDKYTPKKITIVQDESLDALSNEELLKIAAGE
jgi:hypothetical protein